MGQNGRKELLGLTKFKLHLLGAQVILGYVPRKLYRAVWLPFTALGTKQTATQPLGGPETHTPPPL